MPELFSIEDIANIISDNEAVVQSRGEPFCVKREELMAIFDDANTPLLILDNKTRIIKRAAIVLSGITYWQPFCEGNKETALGATIAYLERNGYTLVFRNQFEEDEIKDLLIRTVMKFEDDSTIVSEIEDYLFRRVLPLF